MSYLLAKTSKAVSESSSSCNMAMSSCRASWIPTIITRNSVCLKSRSHKWVPKCCWSSVSTTVWFYPSLLHPTLWISHSYTPLLPHWILFNPILPIVGTDWITSPSFNLYKIVVLPAASRPNIKIRCSYLPIIRSNTFVKYPPIYFY